MDKYAVDLDQVLNDFEYSELTTEQQSKLAKKPNNYYLNANKNSNVKHSINNVFHSLNEYLNTEISPKSAPIQNEIKTDFASPECSNNRTNESAIKFYDNLQKSNDEGDLNRHLNVFVNNFVQNDFKLLEKNTNNERQFIKTNNNDTTNVEKTEKVSNFKMYDKDNRKITENLLVNEEILVVEVNSDKEGNRDTSRIVEQRENVDDITGNCKNNREIEPEEEGTEDETETRIIENRTEPENESLEALKLEREEMNNVEQTSDPETIPTETEIREINVKDKETTIRSETENQLELVDVAQDKDNDTEPAVIEKDEEIIETDEKEIAIADVAIKPIGFEAALDVDESELSEYLNDIEKEYETNERPSDLPLNDVTSDDKRKIDLIGEPGSTPYNNVYITNELPKQMKHESDTEYSSTSSPTFSDTSTETSSDANEPAKVEEGGSAPSSTSVVVERSEEERIKVEWLGKQAPLWVPDSEAGNCLHCDQKFTVLKRRHHCRACGLVLCSKCCNLKIFLDYLEGEARVCLKCHVVLSEQSSGVVEERAQQPNPNNPLEYCSTVSPLQQGNPDNPAPSVLVPVGVLKRKGSNKGRAKSVMFCDGIRPGSDLTNLDGDVAFVENEDLNRKFPDLDTETKSFMPASGEDLPPVVKVVKNDFFYNECKNNLELVDRLKMEIVGFALQLNLIVYVKLVNLDCCVNKLCWCFTTNGLINVGQDELVYLIEIINDTELVPKDVFCHINNVYLDALKGNAIKEMGITLHNTSTFLDSNKHSGFIYIKPTFQCLQNIIKPTEPYLIGILIHKWETPWAKLFPLRLVLRLGAEYRYYPSPIISTRFRDSVFVEIGHTIINLLADFRNFSYTLPQIRGLTIHMEDKNTTVTIPMNRYDQIMKSMNNSSDHILAFAGNFSVNADSHLVCIQDTQGNDNSYSTHAINILNKTRKVTGASFIVFNGALKSSSGLTAKSSIVEDGLMVQIPSDHMLQIRDSLRNMKNHTINCGCINADSADETVNIVWGENDVSFNLDILSPIDDKPMNGIPSIRVHNGKDFITYNRNRLIRWTEVFIIQNGDETSHNHQEPIDISKISENIAKATCAALVKYLDLLVSNNFHKVGIRTTLHIDDVSYLAGSNNLKLPPIYMKRLDNELIPILHRLTTTNTFFNDNSIVLELIFRILNN